MLRSEVLYQWVKEFYQLDSRTRIRISREVYNGTWDALYDSRADLVIGAIGRPPHEVGFQYVPMGHRQLHLSMSSEHPLAEQKGPLTIDQVLEYRVVDAGDSSRLIVPRNNGFRVNHEQLIVPDLYSQKEAILNGIAVGFMPQYMIASEVDCGVIVTREVSNHENSLELYSAWTTAARGRALEWFSTRLCSEHFRKQFL